MGARNSGIFPRSEFPIFIMVPMTGKINGLTQHIRRIQRLNEKTYESPGIHTAFLSPHI